MLLIAIYVRKSKFVDTSESTENQAKICEEDIRRRFPNEEIKIVVYEDEGYSGATTNRPHFQEMMKNIHKFDILVCYRLDRISRNVVDFAKTYETLQAKNCEFISVKENYDTTTPGGRAMLYMSSVFSQLERETTAERIRDNMLTLAKDGKWTGGNYPLGFTGQKSQYIDDDGDTKKCSKLVFNDSEIEITKLIYKTYMDIGSLNGTVTYLMQNNVRNKKGGFYEASSLRKILENPIYCKVTDEVLAYFKEEKLNTFGKPDGIHSFITYNKTRSIIKNGQKSKADNPKNEWIVAFTPIEGIFEADFWLKVQRQLNTNSGTFPHLQRKHSAILSGKVYCSRCNSKMIVRNGKKLVSGIQNYDYTCKLKRESKSTLCNAPNINTTLLDNLVKKELKELWFNKTKILNKLKAKNKGLYNSNPELEIQQLKKKIADNAKKINRFYDVIAVADDLSDDILPKIRNLKSENTKLEQSINQIEINNTVKRTEEINIVLIEEMLKKCSSIDSLPKEEQERLCNYFIDKIWVDKDTGIIKIDFILDYKKK